MNQQILISKAQQIHSEKLQQELLMFLDYLLFRQTQEAKAKTAYTFLNNDIWEGDAPTDLADNHDHYLYDTTQYPHA